jgi:hypothetical protein
MTGKTYASPPITAGEGLHLALNSYNAEYNKEVEWFSLALHAKLLMVV